VDWFEDMSTIHSPVTAGTSITKINGTDLAAAATPNSLGEWARNVDLDSLFEKRKNIHRQKLFGRPTPTRKRRENPKHASDKEYLIKLSKTLQAPSSPYSSNVKAKELYMASKKADQLGERNVAIDLLQTLLEVTPNDARVYRRLARMYSEEGDLSLARATLQRGLRRSPDNPWLWHGLGQLELSHGCAKAARKFFQRAIDSDPAFAHSHHALGTLEHTHGNIAKSMKILKQGIQYCPTNHRLHHALGDLYRGAKLLEDAERSYQRALKHGPPVSNCFALSALAAVAYEKRDLVEARSWLKQSLQQNDGRHAQGWLALSQMEEAEGNVEIARKVCTLAISRYEKGLIETHQRHYKHRGPISTEKDQVKTKERLLRQIPRYRPGDKFLKVYRNLARLEERYGSFESVDDVYRRASLVFPNEYKVTMDWASYYATMRNYGRARTLYLEACNKALNR
jgi:tetratricopeptide (TPR) repeat protein